MNSGRKLTCSINDVIAFTYSVEEGLQRSGEANADDLTHVEGFLSHAAKQFSQQAEGERIRAKMTRWEKISSPLPKIERFNSPAYIAIWVEPEDIALSSDGRLSISGGSLNADALLSAQMIALHARVALTSKLPPVQRRQRVPDASYQV